MDYEKRKPEHGDSVRFKSEPKLLSISDNITWEFRWDIWDML